MNKINSSKKLFDSATYESSTAGLLQSCKRILHYI